MQINVRFLNEIDRHRRAPFPWDVSFLPRDFAIDRYCSAGAFDLDPNCNFSLRNRWRNRSAFESILENGEDQDDRDCHRIPSKKIRSREVF